MEIIDRDEWKQELEALYGDLLGPDGGESAQIQFTDNEASMAFSKVTAVYPHLTKASLKTTTIDSLLEDTDVGPLLGSTRRFSARTGSGLHKDLRVFIDSPEKSADQARVYWPLVRVVRL